MGRFILQVTEQTIADHGGGRTLITATVESIDQAEVADDHSENLTLARTIITRADEQIDPSENR